MAFVLNTHRTYKQKANMQFADDKGKTHQVPVEITWRSIPKSEAQGEDRDLLDVVLLSVEGLEFQDDDGAPVDTLTAVKDDPMCAVQLIELWRESLEKNSRKRT